MNEACKLTHNQSFTAAKTVLTVFTAALWRVQPRGGAVSVACPSEATRTPFALSLRVCFEVAFSAQLRACARGPSPTSPLRTPMSALCLLFSLLGLTDDVVKPGCNPSWCDAQFAKEHCSNDGCRTCDFCSTVLRGTACPSWCDPAHHCAGLTQDGRCAGCIFCSSATHMVATCASWCSEDSSATHCVDAHGRCAGCAFCAPRHTEHTAVSGTFACEQWCDAHVHCADARCQSCADVVEQCGPARCADWCSIEHAGKHCLDDGCKTCNFCEHVVMSEGPPDRAMLINRAVCGRRARA